MNKSARAFAAGLRHASLGHAARWRECWCCRVIVEQGRESVQRYAQATYRDEDTVYRMARAANLAAELYSTLRAVMYTNERQRQDTLAEFRTNLRGLPYMHFIVTARNYEAQLKTETAWAMLADMSAARETRKGVRSYAGHTAQTHSIVRPLWTAETVAEYLGRMNGATWAVRFVLVEGAEWADVERVSVKAERK